MMETIITTLRLSAKVHTCYSCFVSTRATPERSRETSDVPTRRVSESQRTTPFLNSEGEV